MSEPNQSNSNEARQTSGIRFPKLPLSKLIPLAKAVYELGDNGDYSVPRAEALNQINRAATGGASDTLVAATNAYGLLKTAKEKMSLTETGKLLVTPEAAENEKRQAAYDLLSTNKIFADLASRYTDRALPPADKTIHLHLTQNHNLSQKEAETFWNVTQENLRDFGLMKELENGTRMILPRPVVIQPYIEMAPDIDTDVNIEREDKAPIAKVEKRLPITPTGLAPEFHFNIQIHLPENSTAENYDAIFKSIATHLLGRNELRDE